MFITFLAFVFFGWYTVFKLITGAALVSSFLAAGCVAVLLFFKIQSPNQANANAILQPHKISVIAHRGAGDDAPENTVNAIRKVSSESYFSSVMLVLTDLS